ncbi:MAG TPA: arginine--tRNA ligase [Actinomycetota bacterium]
MADPKQLLADRFSHAIVRAFGEEHAGVDPVIRPAQHPRFGDYQANVALSLGRTLGMAPREVAERIVEHLDLSGLADPPEVAGPGFVNLRLRPEFLAREAARLAADPRLGVEPSRAAETVVVDYSGPNVAKEMHVGHLRSTIIGDAIARILEFLGDRVIRQNHLGDWGTQFGVLIEYLVETGRAGGLLESGAGTGLDLTALYREGVARFESDPGFAGRARARVVALQGGDPETLAVWRCLVETSARHFEAVYQRLGVTLTPADTRGESFYNPMLDAVVGDLERAGLVRENRRALCVLPPGFQARDGEPLPLIVRKSDGGYPYAATDLAAIRYRVTELGANRIAYVVDARQTQHFAMVFATARMAGWLDGARAEHVVFGAVLGDDGRPFKTRSGEMPRLADLLDEAVRRAADVVAVKSPDLSPEEAQRVAEVVGIGAVKFADLANDRTRDYVFSWERMLAMDGNTAPYLQYAYARARSILRKAEQDGDDAAALAANAQIIVGHPAERALVLQLLGFGEVVAAAAETLEPHRIAGYLFDAATLFSSFFEQCPVLAAPSPGERRSRLILCDLVARILRQGLSLLGIEVLEKM